jgi:hypothetical protein
MNAFWFLLTRPSSEAERERLGDELGHEVDQADGPILAHRCRVGLLGEQGQERLVEAMEAAATEGVYLRKGFNHVVLNSTPASAQEFRCEAVGPWCFPRGETLDRAPDLSLRERGVQVLQVLRGRDQLVQVKGNVPRAIRAKQGVKVRERSLGHVFVVGEEVAVREDAVDTILLPVEGAVLVEVGGVGVAVLEHGEA